MTNERYEIALKRRAAGKTFREIGAELNVSVERARQMVLKAERLRSRLPEWDDGLDPTIANILFAEGFTSKAGVIDGLKSGAIKAGAFPNFGPMRLSLLRQWLDR